MDAKSRQKALDAVTPEELAKVKAHLDKSSGVKVDNEWLILTEFALLFGWQAYNDVKNDLVTTDEMLTLITAARKVQARYALDLAQSVFIGSFSSRSDKPIGTLKKLTKELIKQTKADE